MFLPFAVAVAIFCHCCCLFLFTVACYCIHIEMILHCWIGLAMLHHLVYSLFSSFTSCCVRMWYGLGGFHSLEMERETAYPIYNIHAKWLLQKHKFLMAYQTNTHDLSTIYVGVYVFVLIFVVIKHLTLHRMSEWISTEAAAAVTSNNQRKKGITIVIIRVAHIVSEFRYENSRAC